MYSQQWLGPRERLLLLLILIFEDQRYMISALVQTSMWLDAEESSSQKIGGNTTHSNQWLFLHIPCRS